jgi:hypothetical protein
MLREELTARLSDFEGKQRVGSWKWNGWHAWPAVRNQLTLSLHQRETRPLPSGWKARAGGIWARRRQRLQRWLSHQLAGGPRPEDPTDVVFLTSTDRGQPFGGQLYNTVVDPWVEEVRRTGHRACVWDLGDPRRGALSSHAAVQHAIDAHSRRARPTAVATPAWFGELADFAHDQLDTDLRWHDVRRELEAIDAHAALFGGWLASGRPSTLFLDCWYTREGMGAALAARRLGIPTIDLQHGIQGHAHPAYAGWCSAECGQWEVMPDAFWVWGPWDAESLVRSNPGAIRENRIRIVGHRWLHAWAEEEGRPHRDAIREAQRLTGADHTVCFTLQKGVPYREILALLVEQAPIGWRWLVRLHRSMTESPGRLEAELRETLGPNIEVAAATRLPLHALLRVSDWHVTGFSTCALEALPFGVPTLLTHESGEHAFAEFIEAGVMQPWRSVEEAVGLLAKTTTEQTEECRAQGARVFAPPAFGGPWCTPS